MKNIKYILFIVTFFLKLNSMSSDINFEDCCKTLELNPEEVITLLIGNENQIKKVVNHKFRQMSLKYHPDMANGNNAKFQKINQVHKLLLNAKDRNALIGPDKNSYTTWINILILSKRYSNINNTSNPPHHNSIIQEFNEIVERVSSMKI